ncbi:MAG: formamidopyrimidine-DNA glycosylase [Chloroflexi bacterium]|nr:formamidopyrimidine-DNA glycosylase [Chloroflexota bacterium]MYE39500.1 formamidopyrimidine-DNA glycosylase [Chloroflexota bacterium]
MPELPEVESVRRSLLRSGLAGRTITRADIGWANSVKHPSAAELASSVAGRTVEDIGRRAKYLLFPLAGQPGATFVAHLGMTGNLVVQPGEQPPHPMTRHAFALDDGRELRFVDGRKFGKLWLAEDLTTILPPLGPEPLGDEFTTEWLAGSFAKRNAPVKALLLEQSIAAGVGNIYADEALFLSGIRPDRPASGLSADEVARLRQGIIDCINAGFAVYDRVRDLRWPEPPEPMGTWSHPRDARTPCPNCGGAMTSMRIRARGTWYCAACQV